MATLTIRGIDDELRDQLKIRATVATRNVDDFADVGADLVNPWIAL